MVDVVSFCVLVPSSVSLFVTKLVSLTKEASVQVIVFSAVGNVWVKYFFFKEKQNKQKTDNR